MSYNNSRFSKPSAKQTSARQRSCSGTILALTSIGLFALGGMYFFLKHNDLPTPYHQPDYIPSPDPQRVEQQVFIVYQTRSLEAAKFASNANYTFSRSLNSEQYLNIDVLEGDETTNIYSRDAEGSQIEALQPRLRQTDSSDAALIKAMKRIKDLAVEAKGKSLNVFLISEGTRNSEVLKIIHNISQKMAKTKPTNAHIYLIGLLPANKLPMSEAFHPIREAISGSCINQYSQCQPFIENLNE